MSIAPAPAVKKADDAKKKDAHPRDPAREAIETIVFVVVLVLLLKLFVTEAFVIPTGSMAETLYGYQKLVTCPKCGHEFPVNSHDEVEPNQRTNQLHQLLGYCCPNCRHCGEIKDLNPVPSNRTGDRVLVLKPLYHLAKPQRGDVVVFKFPEAPQQRQTAQNYIKRAMGFGGETIGIHRGDLYVATDLVYPADLKDENGNPIYPRPENPLDLWKREYTYSTAKGYPNPVAVEAFDISRTEGFPNRPGRFSIVRKTDEQVLACMRVVWDNDHQPANGDAAKLPPRWSAEDKNNWKGDSAQQTKTFLHTGEGQSWLRYRHLVWDWKSPPGEVTPRPIDNFLGYNNGTSVRNHEGKLVHPDVTGESMWVGDLIVECEATVGDGAELVLELSKGASRFQAKFAGGNVTLRRTGHDAKEMASRPAKLKAGKAHKLRFANVDCRLRVWVDGTAIDFGIDADYQPGDPPAATVPGPGTDGEGWTQANDVDVPAGIGAKGAVTVQAIKLFRDIYYTRSAPSLSHTGADLMYVQPGHYLCLGDNSASSSDSREWGLVPDRLMLGKAVFVFFPWGRLGFIK